MRLCKTSVGLPHDLLELPELAEESRVAVVDTLGCLIHLGVDVAFNVPDAVWQSTSTRTCNLLLLKAPLWELDLVREKHAAGHDVNEPELGLNSPEALLRHLPVRLLLNNLNAEQIVCVSLESSITVGGNLVLPVGLSDGRTDIVRMETAIRCDVVQPDDTTILNIDGAKVIPSLGASEVRASVILRHDRQGLVLHDPDVVLVLVRVEGDLLLLATGGVHVAVGMEITTLRVPVTKRDTASVSDIRWYILHALGVESSLELRRHETITVTRVNQAYEVNGKHSHVERDGNDDKTEETGEEVLEPQARSCSPCVSEQDPELQEGQAANPCNCEESNPFDTGGCS